MELYQHRPPQILTKESNYIECYRRQNMVRRYSNKEIKVDLKLFERTRD